MEPSGRAADDMGRTETDNADADPSPGVEQSTAISAVTTGADAAEPPVAVRETLSTVEEASDPDVPAKLRLQTAIQNLTDPPSLSVRWVNSVNKLVRNWVRSVSAIAVRRIWP